MKSLLASPFIEHEQQITLDAFLTFTKHFAPYQFNPDQMNPLRDLLCKHIDFDILSKKGNQKVFIAATNINTHSLKIFEKKELTADHILASACLPSIHNPIKIDENYYWDGGFFR